MFTDPARCLGPGVVHGFPAAMGVYCNGAGQTGKGTELGDPFNLVPPKGQGFPTAGAMFCSSFRFSLLPKKLRPCRKRGADNARSTGCR